MDDSNTKTPNLSLQHIGINKTIEPADYNGMLDLIDSQLPQPPVNGATYGTLSSGVTGGSKNISVQRLRLTLTAVSITVTNAHKYGGTQLFVWPNAAIVVVNARMNLAVTKDGVGILAADAPVIGIGSATASNTTLATTMIDTVDGTAMAGSVLTETVQENGAPTPDVRYIAEGTTNKLFLNAGTTGNTGAVDGSLLVSGTIDVDFIDLGLFS